MKKNDMPVTVQPGTIVPIHYSGRESSPTRTRFFPFFTLCLCLLMSHARADDETPLGPDASADDVKQVIDRELPPIFDQIEAAHGFTSLANGQQMHHITNLIKGAKVAVLLDVLSHPESRFQFKGLYLQIIEDAAEASATEADIPDLLSSDLMEMTVSNSGISGVMAPFGPYIIMKHPAWCNSPAVTSALPDLLTNIQAQLSDSPQQISHQGVLQVAKLNRDPGIHAQLKDILTNACNSTDLPPDFLMIVFDTAQDSTDTAIHALVPGIVKAMAEDRRFTDAPNSIDRATPLAIYILSGKAPITNPDFVSGATTCLSAPRFHKIDYTLALAVLGDQTAFATAMKTYFSLSDSNVSDNTYLKEAGGEGGWIKFQTQHYLLPTIAYHGPGDKIEALKDHYQDAVFQNGRWSLTIPGYEATSPSSVSTATTAPGTASPTTAPPNGSPTETLPLLTSVSSEDEVNKALNLVASEICAQASPGWNRGYSEQQKAETERAIQALSNVKIKVLLAVLRAIPTGPNGESEAAVEADVLKSNILSGAISRYATKTDVPDLLAEHISGYWVMHSHPDWCNSDEAAAALTAELKQIQTDPTIFSDKNYGCNPQGTFSLLDIARFNNTPTIQDLLEETIHKAANDNRAPPKLLLAALNTASKSDNPAIHGELPELVAALAKLPDKTRVEIAGSMADSVTSVVERNPTLLRDPDFIAHATACIISATSDDPYGNNYLTFPLPLALLGNSKAFEDCLEIYLESKTNPPQSDLNPASAELVKTKKAVANGVEKWLISSIVYHGSGDKDHDLENHYREAVYQNGQWVLTMPDYVPPSASQPATAPPPSVPTPSAMQPTSVTVTSRTPIETLDSSGQVTAVAPATVGTAYVVVRVDGDKLILKDSSGNQYRLPTKATDYSPR